MRRVGGSRLGTALAGAPLRAAAAAVLAAVLCPAPAPAQLPGVPPIPLPPPAEPSPEPNPPPRGERPPTPGPGSGEVVSYRGNPQNTASFADQSVFGPLEPLWTVDFKAAASQPLIVPGRVIVNVPNEGGDSYGSRVVALDPATGRQVWSQPTPGVYFSAHIAIDGNVVVSLNGDGVLRGFAIDDGRPLWTTDLDLQSHAAAPIARGGTTFVVVGASARAVDSATGALRWTRTVTLDSSSALPALDDRRLFLSDACGAAAALWQADGEVAWTRERRGGCSQASAGIVHDGKLYTGSESGWVYDAATGVDRGAVSGGPLDAIAGELGVTSQRGTRAIELASSAVRWTFKQAGSGPSYDFPLRPVSVGETVFTTSADGHLVGLDRATGELRSSTKIKAGGYYSYGGPLPGISVGQGVVLVPSGTLLHAYSPVLRPAADGIDMAATGFDVTYGKRVGLAGGLGSSLRANGPREVVLEADSYPYGRYARLARGRTYADGTVYFTARPPRNTRYRVRVPDGTAAKPLHVYGYPKANLEYRRAGPNRVQLRLSLRADRGFRVGGRRIVFYLLKDKGRSHPRLGSGRLVQTGRGRARVTTTFRVPRNVSERDGTIWCFKGLRGYGNPADAFNRRCGARVVRE
ncbi:MAG TPA: PQQ-binding-like beta-propeller repeat protein [Thermoleophilaceae bacterium]